MTNLNSVNIGQNKFCGPAVLSILTGRNTDECAYAISRVNGNYNIKGVQTKDLLLAAEQLGFTNESVDTGRTLYGTFVKLANQDGMYIISILKPNHFVTIEVIDKKIYFCDNHTKEPMPAESSSRMHQIVEMAHRVWKKPVPPPPPTPILLLTDYNVVVSNNQIAVDRVLIYKNPDDNRKEQIGVIRTKDAEELKRVLKRIKEELDE